MSKKVCIIGAGPSGLVAAKTLVHNFPKDTFQVTVFEKSPRIGGLWPISNVDDGLVNPEMRVNQSRHTVTFSDFAWPESTPQFPTAWQVGQYLEKYIQTYPGYDIRLNCEVVQTKLEEPKWSVSVKDHTSTPSEVLTLEFDHVIVSTGFFGKPKIPTALDELTLPILHSSQIRTLEDVLTSARKSVTHPGKRIVVAGGQMSGVEIATFIANQLSSAAHSIEGSNLPDIAKYCITHVVQKPLWVMPFMFPRDPQVEISPTEKVNNHSPNFLPLDLVSYNIGARPPGPISNTSGHITLEAAATTHGFLKNFIGTDQSEFGAPEIFMEGGILSEPPCLGVSDQYNEYVRAGLIKLVKGKISGVSSSSPRVINLSTDGEETVLDDVAAVVFATGFDPAPSVSFLSKEILDTLQADPSNDKCFLALNMNSTISNQIPSLGFVGFYRSPYWGVMEMQARFLGKLWSGDAKAAKALAEDTTKESLLKLRTDPRAAQFPMGDYAYLMEFWSDILDIRRKEPESTANGARSGVVLPARYLPANATAEQIEQSSASLRDVQQVLNASSESAKFVPRVIFKAMQGIWKLERSIDSRRSDYPSGTLIGEAHFHPRASTDENYDLEYLYKESGEFVSPQGFRFTATRSYAYRYAESTDSLSAWFVKPKDNKTVDYLFHELEILIPDKDTINDGSQPWKAKSAHLCIKDMYNVKYEFWFKGVGLLKWTQEYTVNGPAKDYTIKNLYRRPETLASV